MRIENARAILRRSEKFFQWTPPPRRPINIPGRYRHAKAPHYSPAELAKLWGVSTETIRTIFRHEPGVLKLGNPGTKYRRAYVTLRIPDAVAERVHTRLSGGE